MSTTPDYIDAVGTAAGVPDLPRGAIVIVVRDIGGFPIANSHVVIDFGECRHMCVCDFPTPGGFWVDCAVPGLRGFTDQDGRIVMWVVGSGRLRVPESIGPCARIFADGVLLKSAYVTLTDLNGCDARPGVDVTDISVWLSDFGSGVYHPRSDYTHDGGVSIVDLARWMGVFGSGKSVETCPRMWCP